MSNLKLNKKVKDEAFEVIPDLPNVNESTSENKAKEENSSNYINIQTEENNGRKLFANKKANIALGIAGGIIAVLILASVIFIYAF